jgi:hypothetical protein
MKRWIWLFAGLLAVAAIAAAEEDTSSAQLVQFAVSMTGNTDQEAAVSGFGTAQSSQVGYSSDGNVTQTVSYDNIRNGSITQWGESGEMDYAERWSYLDSVGDAVNVTNWENGKVNQTIYIRNSEKIFLLQKIGGLKKILFPDQQQVAPVQNANNWWFCGKSENGSSGLPRCAEEMAKRVFNGKASARDYYMLEVLEDNYGVYPPENLTPRVILKKWNITQADGKITIKFSGHNYGKRTYNATLIVDLISAANVVSLEGKSGSGGVPNWDIKLPERKSIEVGSYTVHSSKDLEHEVVLPLNGTQVNDIQMKLVSG